MKKSLLLSKPCKDIILVMEHFCKEIFLAFHICSVAPGTKKAIIIIYFWNTWLGNLALCGLEDLRRIWQISGSCFAKHKLVLSKHSLSKTPNDSIFLVRLLDGGNHTADYCYIPIRQFCLSSPTTVKMTCWRFSTFCSHSQMSIRENLEMEGLYVCREQGQFSVAAVSWWHRLVLTQPTFLLQNHKVKAPRALLPFSIRYEIFPSLY